MLTEGLLSGYTSPKLTLFSRNRSGGVHSCVRNPDRSHHRCGRSSAGFIRRQLQDSDHRYCRTRWHHHDRDHQAHALSPECLNTLMQHSLQLGPILPHIRTANLGCLQGSARSEAHLWRKKLNAAKCTETHWCSGKVSSRGGVYGFLVVPSSRVRDEPVDSRFRGRDGGIGDYGGIRISSTPLFQQPLPSLPRKRESIRLTDYGCAGAASCGNALVASLPSVGRTIR